MSAPPLAPRRAPSHVASSSITGEAKAVGARGWRCRDRFARNGDSGPHAGFEQLSPSELAAQPAQPRRSARDRADDRGVDDQLAHFHGAARAGDDQRRRLTHTARGAISRSSCGARRVRSRCGIVCRKRGLGCRAPTGPHCARQVFGEPIATALDRARGIAKKPAPGVWAAAPRSNHRNRRDRRHPRAGRTCSGLRSTTAMRFSKRTPARPPADPSGNLRPTRGPRRGREHTHFAGRLASGDAAASVAAECRQIGVGQVENVGREAEFFR